MTNPLRADMQAAVENTGADGEFWHLVEQLSARLSRENTGLTAPELRTVLARFHAKFADLHASALERHFTSDQLVRILPALKAPAMQRYRAARAAMAPELLRGLERLTRRMGETPL